MKEKLFWMLSSILLCSVMIISCDKKETESLPIIDNSGGGQNTGDTIPAEVGISKEDWNLISIAEYRYVDASVPPDYHRSYTISITANSINFTIDSYGNELLRRQYVNTPSAFDDFKKALAGKGILKHEIVDDDGCTGGTSEYLRFYKNEDCFFNAYVYHCAGDYGNLYLPNGTAELFKGMVPDDITSLISSTK